MPRPLAALLAAALAGPAGAALGAASPGAPPPLADALFAAWSTWHDHGSTDAGYAVAADGDGHIYLGGGSYIDGGWRGTLVQHRPDGEAGWSRFLHHAPSKLVALPGVLAAVAPAEVVGLDAHGGIRWSVPLSSWPWADVAGAAADREGNLFVLLKDRVDTVVKIAPSGHVAWRSPLEARVLRGLAVLEEAVVAVGSNGYNVYAWALDREDGQVAASRVLPSDRSVRDAAGAGDLAVVAGSPGPFALDASLGVAWDLPFPPSFASASGAGTVALLGAEGLAEVTPAGQLCTLSPRPAVADAQGQALYSLYGALPGEEHLVAVAVDPAGRLALGGSRWSGDGTLGWTGFWDAYVAVEKEVPSLC